MVVNQNKSKKTVSAEEAFQIIKRASKNDDIDYFDELWDIVETACLKDNGEYVAKKYFEEDDDEQ